MLRLLMLLMLLALIGCRRAPSPPVAPLPAGPSAAAISWYLQAVVAEDRGDLGHADRAWGWVAREDRLNPHAHAHRARFLARQRRWPEAEAAWLKAKALDPAWWEPYAGLAALAARRGDTEEERELLDRAVASGADSATVQRAIERHEAAGDRAAARAALTIWLEREDLSDEERRRRWFTAQRLDMADRALGDLRSTVDPRLPTSALMFVDEALSACDLAEALDWAREIGRSADAAEHPLVGVAIEVAARAGDLPLMERLLGLHHPGSAALSPGAPDVRPAAWGRTALAIAGAPPSILLAEGWVSVGARARGEALLDHLSRDETLRGWVQVARALHAIGSGAERLDPATVAPSGPARVAWLLAFVRGQVRADRLALGLRELGPADRIGRLLGALVPLRSMNLIQPNQGSTLRGEPGPDGAHAAGVLSLPPEAYAAWLDEREAQRVFGQMPSRRGIAAWVARSPADPRAHVAMALAEPDMASFHLDRALAIDPCDADALAARAELADERERPAWHRRAVRADPLRPR